MHALTLLLRYFPYWALPLTFALWELGIYFRRRNRPTQWVVWGAGGVFVLLSFLWLIFRGDLYSDVWAKAWFS